MGSEPPGSSPPGSPWEGARTSEPADWPKTVNRGLSRLSQVCHYALWKERCCPALVTLFRNRMHSCSRNVSERSAAGRTPVAIRS